MLDCVLVINFRIIIIIIIINLFIINSINVHHLIWILAIPYINDSRTKWIFS